MAVNDALAAEKGQLRAKVGAAHALVKHCSAELRAPQHPVHDCVCFSGLLPSPSPPSPPSQQVQDLEVRAANAATVIEASRAQVEALRGDKAALQGRAAELGDALASAEARLQALAKRNGELRWAGAGGEGRGQGPGRKGLRREGRQICCTPTPCSPPPPPHPRSLEVDNHRSLNLRPQLEALRQEAAALGEEVARLQAGQEEAREVGGRTAPGVLSGQEEGA